MIPGGENDGASGSLSGASSCSGRTLVTLNSGCFKPFNSKGQQHSLSQRWKGLKRAFNLYVIRKGVLDYAQKRALFFTCHRNGHSGNLL